MSMDAIPVWTLFAATTIGVVLAIEVGYRLGHTAHRRSENEKESPVSAIAATVLGLLAFILAFTFAIVTDRYDARKALVREEANAIRTAWLRSDFLPEPDRGEAAGLLREYVNRRLAAVQSNNLDQVHNALIESVRIQRQLWDMAVVNARKDMNSDVAALYIESLNELSNLHALRVAVGLQARIPGAIWVVLYALVILGMIAVGYQTAIAGSRRTSAMLLLALSFSLVIALIAELDGPGSGYLTVSQQPLVDLRALIAAGLETR
jgi:hypothetical protein